MTDATDATDVTGPADALPGDLAAFVDVTLRTLRDADARVWLAVFRDTRPRARTARVTRAAAAARAGCAKTVRRGTHGMNSWLSQPEFRVHHSKANRLT